MNVDKKIEHINSYVEFLNNATVEQLLEILVNNEEDEEEPLMATRTLKESAAPDVTQQPHGIVFPELEKPLKSNSGFLNLLSKFNGLSGEDPYMHLKAFLVDCSTMKPDGLDEDQVKLHAFPFSLDN